MQTRHNPLLFDKDVSSIIAAFLVETPYKIRAEITPFKLHYLSLVKHPAIKQFITIEDVKSCIAEFDNEYDHFKLEKLVKNPYLESIFRQLFKERDPVVIKNTDLLIKCPYADIIAKFLNPEDLGTHFSDSTDPDIIDLIEIHLRYADWFELSSNPAAIRIIEKNIDCINWFTICFNPAASHIIKRYSNRIPSFGWKIMSRHQTDYELLRDNISKLDFNSLMVNTSTAAKDIINQYYGEQMASLSVNGSESIADINNLTYIDWFKISSDEDSIDLILANPDKIDWGEFVLHNKAAPIDFLLQHIDKWNAYLDDACVFNDKIGDLIFEIDIAEYKKRKAALTSFICNINIAAL